MKIDGRTLSHETSESIRMMAVRRVLDGERPRDVIKSYGMCRTSIYRWLRSHRRGGQAALRSRPSPGRPCRLALPTRLSMCFSRPKSASSSAAISVWSDAGIDTANTARSMPRQVSDRLVGEHDNTNAFG